MWAVLLLQKTQVPRFWEAKQGTEQACLEGQQESSVTMQFYLARVTMLKCLGMQDKEADIVGYFSMLSRLIISRYR